MRVRIVAAIVVCLASVAGRAQDNRVLDLTGAWTLEVSMPSGPSLSTVTLQQSGSALTGDYSSPSLGDHRVEGRLSNGRIELSFRFRQSPRNTEDNHHNFISHPEQVLREIRTFVESLR